MITSIKGLNFLSFKDFNVQFTNGVTFIDGWNEDDQTSEGSGKSAILNAICWGYFGKIPKDANIDDIIKNGEKSAGVEIEHDDGIIIRRLRNPNELAIVKNGQIIKGKDAKETQLLIEEYLSLTFETFCQTIYFAQNYTKKFITSNQEEKGKILSEVQNLSLFDKASKEVKALIKLEEDSLAKLKHSKELFAKDEELLKKDIQTEKLRRKHAEEQQQQNIKLLSNRIIFEEASRNKAEETQQKRIEAINEQINDVVKAIADYTSAKEEHLVSVSDLAYDEVKEKTLLENNNDLMAQIGVLNSDKLKIGKLISNKTMAKNQGDRYAARYKQLEFDIKKNEEFIANPTKDCPTCGSKLEGCDTSHAEADVNKMQQEMSEILSILTALSDEIDVNIPDSAEFEDKIENLKLIKSENDHQIKEIRSIRDRLNAVANHLNGLDNSIKMQKEKLQKLKDVLKIESRILVFNESELVQLKVALQQEQLPLCFDETLSELNERLDKILSDFVSITNLISEKNVHVNRLEALKVGFKEIKSHVFNSMLNELNSRVYKYLSQLFEIPVTVKFTNEDMKIETKVKINGEDRGLGLLSGGQFRRVSLAVDLALSDIITSRKGSRINLLILDEYFKDLSETSMEKCLSLLENRGQPVLLVEHNSIFKSILNNSIFVKLENGTSRVQI